MRKKALRSFNPYAIALLLFVIGIVIGFTAPWSITGKTASSRQTPSPKPTVDVLPEDRYRAALERYFHLLAAGKYSDALEYHGSGFEILSQWNPDVNPDDHAALLRRGCTANGLQCLEIRDVTGPRAVSSDEMEYSVTFTASDGSVFVQGPCCGATEAEMPPKREFTFTVRKTETGYEVMTQPVYVP